MCLIFGVPAKIEITVSKEENSFTVYFGNAPGEYSIPPQGVKRIEGQPSYEVALDVGKKFVDAHQWEFIEKIDIFEIFIRCWWDGDWGYSVRCGGAMANAGFSSKELALNAARAQAQESLDKVASQVGALQTIE